MSYSNFVVVELKGGKSAITAGSIAGATAGVKAMKIESELAQAIIKAGMVSVTQQLEDMAVGLQTQFSFKDVADSMLAAGLDEELDSGLGVESSQMHSAVEYETFSMADSEITTFVADELTGTTFSFSQSMEQQLLDMMGQDLATMGSTHLTGEHASAEAKAKTHHGYTSAEHRTDSERTAKNTHMVHQLNQTNQAQQRSAQRHGERFFKSEPKSQYPKVPTKGWVSETSKGVSKSEVKPAVTADVAPAKPLPNPSPRVASSTSSPANRPAKVATVDVVKSVPEMSKTATIPETPQKSSAYANAMSSMGVKPQAKAIVSKAKTWAQEAEDKFWDVVDTYDRWDEETTEDAESLVKGLVKPPYEFLKGAVEYQIAIVHLGKLLIITFCLQFKRFSLCYHSQKIFEPH